MVSYFNQTVADMDIDRKYKMELLGMITAILQRHDEDMKHATCYLDSPCEYQNSNIELPSVQPDNDMIHLQKEQAYLQGWEEGREALRKEMWEDGRDRLD